MRSFLNLKISTTNNPIHTDTKAGKFSVGTTVINTAGSISTMRSSFINVVTLLRSPAASFSASPASGYAPLMLPLLTKVQDHLLHATGDLEMEHKTQENRIPYIHIVKPENTLLA